MIEKDKGESAWLVVAGAGLQPSIFNLSMIVYHAVFNTTLVQN